MEEPIVGTLLGPQQVDYQMSVPERLVEETFLRHILPQVKTVSNYIFDASLHFALDAIIF